MCDYGVGVCAPASRWPHDRNVTGKLGDVFRNVKHKTMAYHRCAVESILELVIREVPTTNYNIIYLKRVLPDEVPTYG